MSERPENYDDLLAQARKLFNPVPKKVGEASHPTPCGWRCYEPHLLGTLNPPTYSGTDVLWGFRGPGSLVAEWNLHEQKYERVYGYFSTGPEARGVIVDFPVKDLV